jgi:DUF1680 family protein
LLDPLKLIWEDVVGKKLYVTGACGALYDGASPDGSKDQSQISRTHQAYGRPYQLPNSTAHNETCAAIGNVLWNWRMLKATGEAKYADILELSLYNGVLCGISLDGTRFFYTNTLRQLDMMPTLLRWSREREEYISCFCCPPNVVRVIAESAEYAYGQSDRGVWIHLYGGSTLETELPGKRTVKLRQETDYPWDGRVKVSVTAAPDDPFTMFLRIPGWTKDATLRVNDEPIRSAETGRYAEIKRVWKAGDVIALSLPMTPKLLQAHPLVEEARNQVAVKRGPIVYCLESVDLPLGATVQTVALPRSAMLTPKFERDLLGGVTVLAGNAEVTAEAAWSGGLYREYDPGQRTEIKVKLVPYYAWGNRGRSEMSVWLPLGR